jgi:hypothetical protein
VRYSISLMDHRHLGFVAALPISEVLLYARAFSLEGKLNDNKIDRDLDELKSAGKTVYWVWDVFCNNSDLAYLTGRLNHYLTRIDGVRFLDPGVGCRLQSAFPDLPLQFIMSHGQHNRAAIIGWVERFRPQLRRIVLSNQIPLKALKQIISSLKLDVEITGVGPQVWCYSRRSLLAGVELEVDADGTRITDGHPHRSLTIHENRHGSFVYGQRDLYLLDRLVEIEAAGVTVVGLTLQTSEQFRALTRSYPEPGWENELKAQWGAPVSAGFFDGNATGEALTVLVNPFLQSHRAACVGTVIEAVKNSHLLLSLRKTVPLPLNAQWISPEYKRIEHRLFALKDLSGRTVRNHAKKGLYRVDWIKHVVPGTLLLHSE